MAGTPRTIWLCTWVMMRSLRFWPNHSILLCPSCSQTFASKCKSRLTARFREKNKMRNCVGFPFPGEVGGGVSFGLTQNRYVFHAIGSLHDPVTWYKITDAERQVAQ